MPGSRAETPGETKQRKEMSSQALSLNPRRVLASGERHVLQLSVAGGVGALGGVGAPGGGLCVVWGLWLRLAQG